jgi:hypothetical protein
VNGESSAPLAPEVETVIEPNTLTAKSVAKRDEGEESLPVVAQAAGDEDALLVSRSAEAPGALNVRR